MLICAGSGRCGTLSLAKLLNNCNNTHITHEREPHLPWNADKWGDYYLNTRLKEFEDAEFSGDVASYYLPYLVKFGIPGDMRVVVLKRDKEEVIESFADISGNMDNWRKGKGMNRNPVYGPCFPKFEADSKKEALGKYWEHYYHETNKLDNKAQVFNIDALNSKQGQDSIFNFVEIPKENRVYPDSCHWNARNKRMREKNQ